MNEEVDKDKAVKKMSELLRSGAVMLDQTCPLCGLPLFKLRSGEVVCSIHGPVRVVKSESEAIEATTSAVLNEAEKLISMKLYSALKRLSENEDVDEYELKKVVYLLDILERVRRIKKT